MAQQNGMIWDGMKEFQAALRALPGECQSEATTLTEAGVRSAFATIQRVYESHRFTGTLANRLRVSTRQGGLVLISGSPLAWLFDNGSQARHYVTEKGVTHLTGRMPANHVFSRTVGFTRRTLTEKFRAMLLRRGAATVTVD